MLTKRKTFTKDLYTSNIYPCIEKPNLFKLRSFISVQFHVKGGLLIYMKEVVKSANSFEKGFN